MTQRLLIVVVLILGASLFGACVEDRSQFLGDVSSFQVSVTSGSLGSEASPLTFSEAGVAFALSIQAIDGNGEAMSDWDGSVTVSSVPGELDTGGQGALVAVTQGVGSVSLSLKRGYGRTHFWIEDLGTDGKPGSYATGVSEDIWFENPTIRDLQESESTTASPFEGQRVTVDRGNLVVTSVTHEGFYVTDTTDSEWNSLYVFSFNRPDDLYEGDLLTSLSGSGDEFLGFTEFQNPDWIVAATAELPSPVVLDCDNDVQAGGISMERWEASLVEVANAEIEVCSSYPSCEDYDEYKQWTVELPCGAKMNVVSQYSLPDLDPRENKGKTMSKVRGTLRHIQYANPEWILEPASDGVCCPDCTPALTSGC